MKRTVVGLLVLAVLAWRTGASLLAIAREVFAPGRGGDLAAALTAGEEERLRRGLAALEERFVREARALPPAERARRGVGSEAADFGIVRGRELALVQALRRLEPPPPGAVLFVAPRNAVNGWTYSHVRVLVWPVAIEPVQELPDDPGAAAASLAPGTVVVELGPPAELGADALGFGAAGLERAAEGPGFVVWRKRGPG